MALLGLNSTFWHLFISFSCRELPHHAVREPANSQRNAGRWRAVQVCRLQPCHSGGQNIHLRWPPAYTPWVFIFYLLINSWNITEVFTGHSLSNHIRKEFVTVTVGTCGAHLEGSSAQWLLLSDLARTHLVTGDDVPSSGFCIFKGGDDSCCDLNPFCILDVI